MIGKCFRFANNRNVYTFLGYDFTDFRYVFISVSGVNVRVKAIVWEAAIGQLVVPGLAA